jgi:hypothetical protein
VRLWLAALGVICLAGVLTHTGSRNGFLASSRPVYSDYSGLADLPAEGYVSWLGSVPVLHDAESFIRLVALFLGQHGPEQTGFLDRRAGYAYLVALVVPWSGAYAGFLAANVLLWWASAAATFWLVRCRWGDTSLAWATSLLVAAGHGFVFMAGLPMSYVAAYAGMALLLALGERLEVFRAPRWSAWLVLGWGAGVASTIYFTHVPIAIFWWVYGLRRVPWRYLAGATALAFAISFSWEVVGTSLVGLAFLTDNTAQVGEAIGRWLANVEAPWSAMADYFRGSSIRGTLLGAFWYPWWLLAAVGFAASTRADREWALAVGIAGLVPALAILAMLPLPRIAYYMYPAVYVMAAKGALALGHLAARWFTGGAGVGASRPVALAVAAAALAGLCLASNVDLVGFELPNVWFHFSAGSRW